MNSNLKEKSLIIKAKCYAINVKGIGECHFSIASEEELSFYKEKMSEIMSYSFTDWVFEISHPVDIDDLIFKMLEVFCLSEKFNCFLIFDGVVKINVDVENCYDFLKSIFSIHHTYDLTLFFPHRLIHVSDDEYTVKFFDGVFDFN
ncbi:hypothetical protein H4F64_21705 [Pectobacterium brasiliense]|uniref:hypothetical protein n=1 Tax=Pectobacterium brasiliense TaxID=180957 RepID=UPI0019696E8B|nr:hypothetical protein [Pectobacterium brasiliense]MBN3192790.1 hypothetical protein [Pectobacterium brasiliense]